MGGKRSKESKIIYDLPTEAFSLGSLASLIRSASVAAFSVTVGTEGHLGFAKKSRGNGLEESGMPFGTFGWLPRMLCLNIQHP